MKNSIIQDIKFNEWYWNKKLGTAFRCKVEWDDNVSENIRIIEEWCKDNLNDDDYDIQRAMSTSNGNPNPSFTVYTHTDEAAMAYKLRWL